MRALETETLDAPGGNCRKATEVQRPFREGKILTREVGISTLGKKNVKNFPQKKPRKASKRSTDPAKGEPVPLLNPLAAARNQQEQPTPPRIGGRKLATREASGT